MTTLQFIQAHGLGYTRGMHRVPLSLPTYDSVIKVHGMHGFSLIPRPLSFFHMAYDLAAKESMKSTALAVWT